MFPKRVDYTVCKIVLHLFCIYTVCALRRNDTCLVEDTRVLGVCKAFLECDYATRLVMEEMKHPPHCAFEGNEEIVCCPLVDKPFANGGLRNAFENTENGILRSDTVLVHHCLDGEGKHREETCMPHWHVQTTNPHWASVVDYGPYPLSVRGGLSPNSGTCTYDGNVPAICCDEKDTQYPEPRGCPVQRIASRNNNLAWTKCKDYQRYVDVCTPAGDDAKSFTRRRSCSMSAFADRITGGSPALTAEFPHMVLLGCRNTIDFSGKVKWVSGGTLISDRFVLTAAHAIFHPEYGNVQYALMGVLDKKKASDGALHHVVGYEQFKLYNKNEKYHDIALLTLFPRVQFSDFIRPACLPSPGMKLSESLVVAGWGEVYNGGPTSDILLKTFVEEKPSEVCQISFDPQGLPRGWDARTMLCAGGKTSETNDSCRGDSGGPLMAYLDEPDLPCSYVVVGIVSWGPHCGHGSPGVYTRVQYSQYMDWIVNKVWPKS